MIFQVVRINIHLSLTTLWTSHSLLQKMRFLSLMWIAFLSSFQNTCRLFLPFSSDFPTSLSHIVQVLPNSYKLISWISLLLLLFLDIELLHLFIGSWNCNYEAHLAQMIYLVFMLLGNECYTILSALCGGNHNATHWTSYW